MRPLIVREKWEPIQNSWLLLLTLDTQTVIDYVSWGDTLAVRWSRLLKLALTLKSIKVWTDSRLPEVANTRSPSIFELRICGRFWRICLCFFMLYVVLLQWVWFSSSTWDRTSTGWDARWVRRWVKLTQIIIYSDIVFFTRLTYFHNTMIALCLGVSSSWYFFDTFHKGRFREVYLRKIHSETQVTSTTVTRWHKRWTWRKLIYIWADFFVRSTKKNLCLTPQHGTRSTHTSPWHQC